MRAKYKTAIVDECVCYNNGICAFKTKNIKNPSCEMKTPNMDKCLLYQNVTNPFREYGKLEERV